jgi:single-strand DNA-binding protein
MSKQYSAMIPNELSAVHVAGRVTRDAEMRFTDTGKQVTNLSVAVSRRYNDQGEWKEVTQFLGVAVWGEDAAPRAANIKKGDIVLVAFSVADLKARAYETQSGEQRVAIEVGRAQVSRIAWAGGDAPVNGAGDHAEVPAEDDIPF